MSISKPFIIRPIATSLLMFAILLAGILAHRLLPISSLPEVDYPVIEVVTSYPGANADVMATSVTSPLEVQLGQMSGLNSMTSNSSYGASTITLEFTLDIKLDVAEQQVQAAINAATNYLPKDLPSPPIYNKVNPADAPIITIGLTSKTIPLSKVEDLAETRLAQKISQILGVGLVSVSGGQRPAVRVQVNPTKLANLGLATDDIINSITSANLNAAKGSLDGEQISFTINANDQLISAKDYADLIVAYINNAPIRLADVGKVIDGVEDIRQAAWINKTPAIILNVQRQPGANVINVADSIKQLLPKLSSTLPSSIELKILSDRTKVIRASIADVSIELLLAIILVIAVIFVFLRTFSATIIPSIAVPLSLIGSFVFMYLMGFSLNNLTLMALTISTGFVVDDAIVMIENITRYIEEGMGPREAALKGSEQIGFTILSLTISLIAVLIPLFFMQDIVGRLFREFAITLTITIIISAFVSLTLTPMLCSLILKAAKDEIPSKFAIFSEKLLNSIINSYSSSLTLVLKYQKRTLYLAIITLILTCVLFYFVPKGFFPEEDISIIQGVTIAEEKISFAAMQKKQQEFIDILLEDKAVDNISSFIGIDNSNYTLNSGRMQIVLVDKDKRNVSVSEFIKRTEEKLSKIIGAKLYLQPVEDISIDSKVTPAKYELSISSENAADLKLWSEKFLDLAMKNEKIKDIISDQQPKGKQILIEVKRDIAAKLGISMQSIDNALYNMFGQKQISTIYTQRNQYHVVIEALPSFITGINTIENIYLKTSDGGSVPLKVIANIKQAPIPLLITRQGQFPVVNFSFNLAEGVSLGAAIEAIDSITKELNFPEYIQVAKQGTTKAFSSSLNNEGFLIFAAIIVVYIVLGVLYESYIHPITILSTLPSAAVGALLALILTRNDFDVIGLIGIILLIGIVKKNAIMMIDFALDQQRNFNKTAEEAIFAACLLRFRPILMTTMCALLGAVPLAFGSGMGAELRHPLGITIIGGLIVSQVLTLYTTPVIYLTFEKLATRLEKKSQLSKEL